MKKLTIIIIAVLALPLVASAQDAMRQLFASENAGVFRSLTLATRYELLNKYDRGDTAQVLNNLRTEETRILSLSPTHMLLKSSAGKTVEMKLLFKSKSDTVIAVIETVATPVKDSKISFYDTKWSKLDGSKFFAAPTAADFITSRAPRDVRDALLSGISFAMIEMKFKGETLVATCNLNDFFMAGDFKSFQPYVIRELVYTIDKAKIKRK